MKRLLLVFMLLALSAAGCGGVKTGSAADAGPDGDHRADDGGTDDGGTDGDGTDGGGSGSCVLGTSQLGNCNL
jgi:uncharacterized protein YceK